MEIDYTVNNKTVCPKVDCRKKACKCGLKYVFVPAALAEEMAPKNGDYCNAIVKYEGTGDIYIFSSEGIPTKMSQDVSGLAQDVERLEREVEELKNVSSVVDIVGTYVDLQTYDTSKLVRGDILGVLADETHDNNFAFYRFGVLPDSWEFVGQIAGGGGGGEVEYYSNAELQELWEEA